MASTPPLNKIPEIIETERLILRCPQRGDGDRYFAAVHETFDDLKPWFGPWAKDRPSKETVEQWVVHARDQFLSGSDLTYFVFEKSHDTLIGRAFINKIDWSVPKGMLGYWTRSSHQRMGFAREFVRCINALVMERLQFQRLELYIDPRNHASLSLAGKLGYCLEGRMRNYAYDNFGQMKDYLIYSLTPADYFQLMAFAVEAERRDEQSCSNSAFVTTPGAFCPLPMRCPDR